MFKFHKVKNEQELRFYQMPKILFTGEKYQKMSLGAKAMYSVLRDRQELSIKNNWVDEDDNIYLIFTVENLCELLGASNKTVIKYKKELVKHELLFEKRQGQGKPNLLYIGQPDYSDADSYKTSENNYSDKESYPQGQSIENTKTCNNYISRNVQNTSLEVKKLHTNDTDISDTEFIDTHSFESERVNEYIDNDELEKILDNAEVKEDYLKDNYYSVKRAIESLYYRNVNLNVNGMSIPPSKIRRDLLELNYFHVDMGIKIFKEQSTQQKIVNRISYLATCIYTSIFDMELKIQNDLIYDGLI